MLNQIIQVTLGHHEVTPIVHMVQTDTGRTLRCIVKDYMFDPTDGVALICMRPDGSVFSYSGTVDTAVNSADFDLDLDGGALSQAGTVACHVIVTDTLGDVVSSFRLNIIVHEVIGGEATPDDITFLDGLQAQLTAWMASAATQFIPTSRTINGKALTSNVTLDASDIPYDGTASGLTADDVQEAVDELAGGIADVESDLSDLSDVVDDKVDTSDATVNGKSLPAQLYVQDFESKNILNSQEIVQGSLGNSGEEASSSQRLRTGYIPVTPDTTYTISMNSTASFYYWYEYNSSKSFIRYVVANDGTEFTFTTGSTTSYVRFLIRYLDGSTIVPSNVTEVQLELGSEKTTYVPYAKTNVELTQDLGIANSKTFLFARTGISASQASFSGTAGQAYLILLRGNAAWGDSDSLYFFGCGNNGSSLTAITAGRHTAAIDASDKTKINFTWSNYGNNGGVAYCIG